MIVAVTGHRPDKLGGYRIPNNTFQRVMEGLDKALLTLRPDHVITGMAQGVDQWMAELCHWNGIPFTAAIPFQGFENEWPMPSQMKFRRILANAARVEIVCPGEPARWKYQRRNMWMVDHCEQVIAVFDGSDGGTKNCLDYALQCRRPVWRVPFITESVAPVVRPAAPVVLQRASAVLRERAIPVREIPPNIREAQRQQISEGQRAARRSAEEARLAAEREEQREEQEQRRRAALERRVALSAARQLLDIMESVDEAATASPVVAAEEKPVASKKEQKKDDGPVIREFTRIVDLDM